MKLLAVFLIAASALAADKPHAAIPPFHGVYPVGVYWIGYPFVAGSLAAAFFASHANDAQPAVLISTGDKGPDRFVVFFQVRGDGFYLPDSALFYQQVPTGTAALAWVNGSPAKLKGFTSLPDGQTLVWSVTP